MKEADRQNVFKPFF